MRKGFIIRKRDFPQAWGWISAVYKIATNSKKNPSSIQGTDADIKDFVYLVIFQIESDYDEKIDAMFDYKLKRELANLKLILRDL